MRIAVGADHAGFALKVHFVTTLTRLGHEVDDHGTDSDAPVDYPAICASVARTVAAGRADRGIVIGGSGQGEQMAANKVLGARAALCNDLYTARLVARSTTTPTSSRSARRIVGFGLADEILDALARHAVRGRPASAPHRSDRRNRTAAACGGERRALIRPSSRRSTQACPWLRKLILRPAGARWPIPIRDRRGRSRTNVHRQNSGLELIASENFVSQAVLEAAGSVLTNKYAEGYPGKRYYGGCEFVDVAESLAIARAKELFGAEHVNVQPHSGAQANMAVYFTLLKPGDTVLGMNLAHGGHLTHGHPLNFSGKLYTIVPYGVRKDDERIDYDELERLAHEHKPKMIMVGASAYPRVIDFERIGRRRQARRARRSSPTWRTSPGSSRPACTRARCRTPISSRRRRTRRCADRAAAWSSAAQQYAKDLDRTRVPGHPGRPADAHHRGQGGLLQGSAGAGVRRVPAADRRQRRSGWRPACRPPASGWSAAAPTIT